MITDTPADAESARIAHVERIRKEFESSFQAVNNRCSELINALDADDGSRAGRAILGETSPGMFRSIYGRYPRTGFRHWLLGS